MSACTACGDCEAACFEEIEDPFNFGMRKVKAAQYIAAHPGEVCPAKWKEGAETLKPSLELVGKI